MNDTPVYDDMVTELVAFPVATLTEVSAGDTFTWLDEVTITVQRVAKDRTWCDLRCECGDRTWTKRQSLPLSANFIPVDEAG